MDDTKSSGDRETIIIIGVGLALAIIAGLLLQGAQGTTTSTNGSGGLTLVQPNPQVEQSAIGAEAGLEQSQLSANFAKVQLAAQSLLTLNNQNAQLDLGMQQIQANSVQAAEQAENALDIANLEATSQAALAMIQANAQQSIAQTQAQAASGIATAQANAATSVAKVQAGAYTTAANDQAQTAQTQSNNNFFGSLFGGLLGAIGF